MMLHYLRLLVELQHAGIISEIILMKVEVELLNL